MRGGVCVCVCVCVCLEGWGLSVGERVEVRVSSEHASSSPWPCAVARRQAVQKRWPQTVSRGALAAVRSPPPAASPELEAALPESEARPNVHLQRPQRCASGRASSACSLAAAWPVAAAAASRSSIGPSSAARGGGAAAAATCGRAVRALRAASLPSMLDSSGSSKAETCVAACCSSRGVSMCSRRNCSACLCSRFSKQHPGPLPVSSTQRAQALAPSATALATATLAASAPSRSSQQYRSSSP